MPDRKIKGSRSRKPRGKSMEIPINIEKILLRAAGDDAFCSALLENATRAVEEKGFGLRDSEKAILGSMPRSTLEAMIGRIGSPSGSKGRFARHVAAAVAGSMIITAAACGDDEPTRGATADVPDDTAGDTAWPDLPTQGIMPDLPDIYEEVDLPDIDDEDAGEPDV